MQGQQLLLYCCKYFLTTLELRTAGGVAREVPHQDQMIRALRLGWAVLQPADLLGDGTAASLLCDELLPRLQWLILGLLLCWTRGAL